MGEKRQEAFELSSLSQAERDERLAAAVTSYGVGTKSYNSSAEKREADRQRADVTERYEKGELKFPTITVGPICGCLSFRLPHEISRHNELFGDYDWTPWQSRRREIFQERVR